MREELCIAKLIRIRRKFVLGPDFYFMHPSTRSCPSPLIITLVLWLLTRLVGGLLLLGSVSCFVAYFAEPERIPNPSNPDFADGLGAGAAMGLLLMGGVGLDFFGSLPLLLGLPASVRRVQRLPPGQGRGRRFALAVAAWQALPSLLVVGWMLVVYPGELTMLAGGLYLVALYLTAALLMAALLYRNWLAGHDERA